MLLSKSAQAFTWSAERLFDEWPKIYFWTFTFIHTPYCDDEAMYMWATFMRRLNKKFPYLQGLRVCELHRSHGIHFHAFFSERVPIRVMQKIWHGTGDLVGQNHYLDFGRVSVATCDKQTIGYMTKYMTKQYREDNYFGRRRRWGTIGGFEANRVNDIEVISEATRNREALFGKSRCCYSQLVMIQHYSNLWGCVTEWPIEHRMLVLRQTTKFSNWQKEAKEKQHEAIYIKLWDDMVKHPETQDFKIERTGYTWESFTANAKRYRGREGLAGPEAGDYQACIESDDNNSMAGNCPF